MCSILALSSDDDVSTRCLEHLEHEICELAAHLAAATCRWLLLVAEFDARGGWADWGARSCAHWLSSRCGLSLVTAREHVRVARRLNELPLVRDAFSKGELTYCKVRAIARVATPEVEESLVELARHATGAQVEKLARGYGGALAATTEAAQRRHERRHLITSRDEDGSLLLSARLTPEDGAVFLAALKAAEESVTGDSEDSAESPFSAEDAAARRGDALVAMARSALSDESTDSGDADATELVVHVDAASLAGERIHERCELASGHAIAPETARRLGCDGSVVRIIERDGRPLTVGRRKRTIPAAIRRALRSRDDGCCFPGCTHRRFMHAHHIQHWARGGSTTLENLVQLCSYHHRLVHEGGFSVERAAGHGIRFRRPDGRLISQSKARAARWGRDLERQNRAVGLKLDAESLRPRSAGDRLDYGIAVEGLLARALAAT